MMDTSDGQDKVSCSEVTLLLEKEVSEEILSNDEKEALTHHLDHCRQCNEIVKLTSSLPHFVDELTAEELDSAVRAIMDGASQSRSVERSRTVRWTSFALAASVAAVILLGGLLLRNGLSGDMSLPTAAARCTPVDPTEVVPGVLITYCNDQKTGATVEKNGDVKVALRNGTVGLRIDPARPHKNKVTVETPLGEVRVKGTVFTVHVDEEGAWVEVFRGIVEVVTAEEEPVTFNVSAGQGAELGNRTTFELSEPKTNRLRRRLSAKALEINGETPRNEGPEGMLAEDTPEPSTTGDSDEQIGMGEQISTVTPGVHHGSRGSSRRSTMSIDTLIQNAQSCLIDRDWRCAASQYQEVLRRYSRRPESMFALISLAKIELRHLKAPKKALSHYKTYQKRAPNGPLAEEALFGTAEAYRRLGMEDKELETLRQFVGRYPQSSLNRKARARLEALGANE